MRKSIGIAIEMTALVKVIVVKVAILQIYRNYGNNGRNKEGKSNSRNNSRTPVQSIACRMICSRTSMVTPHMAGVNLFQQPLPYTLYPKPYAVNPKSYTLNHIP